MKRTAVLACIYKHMGKTNDLTRLTKLADEIATMAVGGTKTRAQEEEMTHDELLALVQKHAGLIRIRFWKERGFLTLTQDELLRVVNAAIAGERYAYLPGVAGNYLSTPDSAANSITGDIDIRVRAQEATAKESFPVDPARCLQCGGEMQVVQTLHPFVCTKCEAVQAMAPWKAVK